MRHLLPSILLVLGFLLNAGAATVASAQSKRPHVPLPFVEGADSSYLDELLTRARQERLWEQRLWWVLLHYRDNTLMPGAESEVDTQSFFLSSEGKYNLQAELEATLAHLFSNTHILPGDMIAQCTFPARATFLRKALEIDPQRLPLSDCPRYTTWRDALDPESVSLVFASYYFNNPASMFGHTFMVLNKKGRGPNEAMLNYTVNFGALIPKDASAVAYIYKGTFGDYSSVYNLLPYYVKIKEYNDLERRDLWEYRIQLTPEQLERLLAHLWEMGQAQFDYYFFDENCSYHLLALLEAADPSLVLREKFLLYTIPSDSIIAVFEDTSHPYDLHYRPSRRSLLQQKLDALTDDERDLVEQVLEDPSVLDGKQGARLELKRHALVLDTAVDRLQVNLLSSEDAPQEEKLLLRQLLVRRSKLGQVQVFEQEPLPQTRPPHEGHDSARFALSLGSQGRTMLADGTSVASDSPFVELALQPAFHNFMSRDQGFPAFSETQVLSSRVRYETTAKAVHLERFTAINLRSISPITRINMAPSWQAAAGWERNKDTGCGACVPFHVTLGIGGAVGSHIFSREVAFLMANTRLEWGSAFQSEHRAGFGLNGGVALDLTENWRIAAQGRSTHFTDGQAGWVSVGTLEQRISFSRNLELLLEWRGEEQQREGRMTLGYYF